MGTRDPRVDTYIAKQQEFAQPILTHLRDVVHAACPDVEETIKWGAPFFAYGGSVMCNMAAFKEHAVFGFWKASLIPGLAPSSAKGGESAGNMGRLTSVDDLPSRKALTALIKTAMRLNEDGTTVARPKGKPKPVPSTPPELVAALAKNEKAKTAFEAFPPSHRREYIEWITEARREETRAKRIAQALEWMAEGKSRNWKYQES